MTRPGRETSRLDRLASFAFFAVACVVAFSQTTRAAALWDLSYILEHAWRMHLGDVPYRDFVIPHAPLTFLVQSALIATHGGWLVHAVYCAVIAGLTASLTYALVRQQCQGADARAVSLHATVIALPVVALNGYAIFPQPFYDSDAVFVVLASWWAVLASRKAGTATSLRVIAGVLLVIPVFVKQNIGLPAMAGMLALIGTSAAISRSAAEQRAFAATAAGSALGLAAALTIISAWTGLGPYFHWTMTYAAATRWPSAGRLLNPFLTPDIAWTLAGAGLGYLLIRKSSGPGRTWRLPIGVFAMAVPLVAGIPIMVKWGLAARAARWWALGASSGIAAALAALAQPQRHLAAGLPLLAFGVSAGAFASQGLGDSAYAVWPLLLIGVATPGARLLRLPSERPWAVLFLGGLSAVLLVLGSLHILRQERLAFVDLEGAKQTTTRPAIRGLTTPGSYLGDFEELISWTDRWIPAPDSIVIVPGEDPFFLASGRRPQFPVTLFDQTVTPYSREQLVELLRTQRITWVIVKTDLQLGHSPWSELAEFIGTDLPSSYTPCAHLPRYLILRHKELGAAERPVPGCTAAP